MQHDIECKLPGSALLEVQIWSDVFGADEMIGRTTVDMENRLFTGKWLQYERKPFENRNIFPEGETVSKVNFKFIQGFIYILLSQMDYVCFYASTWK